MTCSQMLKSEYFLTANRDLVTKPTSDGLMLLGPEGDFIYIIKGTGRVLWSQADGKKTIEELIDYIYGKFNAEREAVKKDVITFLKEAVQNKPPLFKVSKKAV